MKMKKLRYLRPVGLVAVGVFLGRGAHADTTLDFNSDASLCTPPQIENPNAPPGITNFGNYAAASSGGVTVSGGFGTPNIGLVWGGIPSPDTRWEYYNDGGAVWAGVQLQGSAIGTIHKLAFVPNSASAKATIKSFNFHGYYNDNERFTYNISVTSGTNVLFGPMNLTYLSDGTKNHPVNVNYTGTPGQTLKLRINRVASTLGAGEVEGDQYNNAIDDIVFAQTPATVFSAGPQVVSVTPADDTVGLPATPLPPYQASITNGATTLVASSIRLKLDGVLVSPPPTISSASGLTNVSYAGAATLLSSGDHIYTLTYADDLGAFYTNDVVFNTTYSTLPPAYASPPGSGSQRGFTWRSVVARIDTPPLDSTIARAVAQLAGTLIDPDTGTPYTNAVPDGTNADGSFNVDTVVNFDDEFISAGNFPGDQPFPGLDAGFNNYFSCEGLLFLDLSAGYYRLGVNSDDGFEFNALPPKGTPGSPIVLGLFDGSRGSSDTLFDFLVPTSGVYGFQLIYFESTANANCELFSVDIPTGNKILINDLSNANAIKSFRVVPPRILTISRSGGNVVLNWAYGNPPFQVQFKNKLTDAWANSGSPTSNRTATVPIQPGAGFFRVVGSP